MEMGEGWGTVGLSVRCCPEASGECFVLILGSFLPIVEGLDVL